MNLTPAIRFAISISNGFLSWAWLFLDFLQRKNDGGSEIIYEFSVFRRETKILLRTAVKYSSGVSLQVICNSFRETISLHIYLLFTGKSSIVDAILKQTGRIEKRIFSFVSNDVIRVQELRRVEWNEYRWLEDGIEEGKPH